VRMANMAPVVNTRGPMFVHPTGIVKRPTFHVLAMYANLLEANTVDTWVRSDTFTPVGKSLPVLDAAATCDDTMQKWSLALINRHPDKLLRCKVIVGGSALAGRHKVTILSGDSPEAYNDIECPDRVRPYEVEQTLTNGEIDLAPHSINLIQT